MDNNQLIITLASQGIITQEDTRKLVMRSGVRDLLKELQQEWPYNSNLESGGYYLDDNELADIFFIYDTSFYDAATALNQAIKILVK